MTAVRHLVWRETKSLAFYVIVLFVFLMLLENKISALKAEINTAVRVECLSGATDATIGRYNDLVSGLVSQQLTAETLNRAKHDTAKAAADAAFAARFKGDQVPIVKPDCSKPLLP